MTARDSGANGSPSSAATEVERLQSKLQTLRARIEHLKSTEASLRRRIQNQDDTIRRLRAKRAVVSTSLANSPARAALPPEPPPLAPSAAVGTDAAPAPASADAATAPPSHAPKQLADESCGETSPAAYTRRLLGGTGHARVTADQLRKIETELMGVSREDVQALFPQDRVLSNFVLNLWEWGQGRDTLESLPWNISLPISDLCNARCTFCTSWLDGKKQLTLEQLEKFEPVLRTAVYVGLVGHGEPLSHPRLGEIADRLAEYLDSRAAAYTITNGVYLAKWLERIDDLRLSTISCSLNAATPETHRTVMGFPVDEFPRVVESLEILASGRATRTPVSVSITMVVTQQNIHEIPAFIELGNRMKARSVYLRTLLPQPTLVDGLNYHLLPPYLHPEFGRLRENAIAAMKDSAIPVYGDPDTWSTPVFPQSLAERIDASPPTLISRADAMRDKDVRARGDRAYAAMARLYRGEPNDAPAFADTLKDGSNPLRRQAPFRCRAVYNNLYVNELFLRIAPCCYLTKTPGHDEIRLMDMTDIVEGWNAASLKALRHRLANGPLFGACERCPEAW